MLRRVAYIIPAALSWLLFGLVLAAIILSPLAARPPDHQCPAILANVSFQGSGFVSGVGPPFYAWPQFVLSPGTTATLVVTYRSFGNNVVDLFRSLSPSSGLFSYYGATDKSGFGAWNQTGVQIQLSRIMYEDNLTAHLFYDVKANSSAPQTTHILSWFSTCYGLNSSPWILLTVGSRIYGGPFWHDQGMERVPLVTVAVRLVGSYFFQIIKTALLSAEIWLVLSLLTKEFKGVAETIALSACILGGLTLAEVFLLL